jgi:hypothetical protein
MRTKMIFVLVCKAEKGVMVCAEKMLPMPFAEVAGRFIPWSIVAESLIPISMQNNINVLLAYTSAVGLETQCLLSPGFAGVPPNGFPSRTTITFKVRLHE